MSKMKEWLRSNWVPIAISATVFVLAMMFLPSTALAQTAPDPTTPDWESQLVSLIGYVAGGLGVSLTVYGVKKLIKSLPRALMPFLAMGLGYALDAFIAWQTSHTFSPIAGALMGALATWLRESQHTVREHGAEP